MYNESHIIKMNPYVYCACILLKIQRTNTIYDAHKGAQIFCTGKFTCNVGILPYTPLYSPGVKAAHRAYNFGIFMGLMLP